MGISKLEYDITSSTKLNALLLGDAAHATSPQIGQGMNTALADAAALNRMLDENNDDWDVVLPLFSQERVKEGHALTDLSFYTFSSSGRQQFSFMIRQTTRQTLNRWLPFLVDPDPMAEVSKGMKLSESYYRMNKIHKVIPAARTVNDEIMR
jgi:kynurenine 3-monooxygenase